MYNNHLFCFYEYRRNIKELDALNNLNKLMILKKISINRIIDNIFNKPLTIYNKKNYVLVLINYEYQENANLRFIEAFNNKEFEILKRNNWSYLWSIKIDYIEYQLKHIKNSYPIINDSVNYYIGMAENAIHYFNMLNLSTMPLYIEHRRVDKNNIYNPIELVIDYKVRDIAEYLKISFVNGNLSIYDIKNYINNLNINNIDYILLYVRMLYPSYYFDLYEKIVNDKESENEIKKILDLKDVYEELLYEIFLVIKKKANVIGIDWINKKYV